MTSGSGLRVIFLREFKSYFATPLAAVFLVVFLFLAGIFSFSMGGLYERGQADLRSFFQFVPWLYLFLAPAIAMRLWAEERRLGTIEILTTLPIPLWQTVVGKFLAAWGFSCVALALTAPLWITVSWLGDPDQGAIVAGYAASAMVSGIFLAIGGFVSTLTKNQVIAFVVTAVACFLVFLAGYPVVLDFFRGWMSAGVVDAVAGVSLLAHFQSLMRGVVELRDAVYFGSAIAALLAATTLAIDWKKGT
ncbi:MAG: ABC transporter permease [Phycisphaerales bacterium]|nr:ABC transporter permease [Phycisphaerales bacterium]